MGVTEIEAWLFHYPLSAPFFPSWVPGYPSMNNSAVIYKLKTSEGIEGIAGGVAFADEAKGPVNLLGLYLSGLEIDAIDQAQARLSAANRTLGIRAWFIETAFWDLKGKVAGKSIAQLLGGTRSKLRAYCSTGQLREPDAAAELASTIVAEGFKGIKIRTRHAAVDKDIAMVKAVREAIGPDIALMCDANQAWRVDVFGEAPFWDVERAVAFAKGVEDQQLEWIEEPLDMYNIAGYAELRKRIDIPIAAGELHGDPGLVRILIDAEGVDIVQPDLCFTGGVSGAFRLAKLAEERGLKFAPHTWTNGIGLAANLQVALAAPNCEWLEFPYDPPGWVPEARDAMLTHIFEIDADGDVAAPGGPGLGVELDESRLTQYGIKL